MILFLDILITNIGLDNGLIDLLFNLLYPFFFNAWLLGIAILYERCGHCIQIGDRSIFTPIITNDVNDNVNGNGANGQQTTLNPINYTDLHQRLKQSRQKKQRVNRYCSVFPFLYIVLNLIAIFRLTIITFIQKIVNKNIFIDKLEPITLFSSIFTILTFRFTYFDSKRPKIEDFDELIMDHPPPETYKECEAKERIKRDLTSNDKCLYKVLFSLTFDQTLLIGVSGLIFTLIFGFIPNLASQDNCIKQCVCNNTVTL